MTERPGGASFGMLVHGILAQASFDATRDVLREYGGLWFYDESYVISRKRG